MNSTGVVTTQGMYLTVTIAMTSTMQVAIRAANTDIKLSNIYFSKTVLFRLDVPLNNTITIHNYITK